MKKSLGMWLFVNYQLRDNFVIYVTFSSITILTATSMKARKRVSELTLKPQSILFMHIKIVYISR